MFKHAMQRLVAAVLIMGMVVPPNRTTDKQKSAECGLDPSAFSFRQT